MRKSTSFVGHAQFEIKTADFGRSVNPISSSALGADYAHKIILAPPDFQTFLQRIETV